MRKESKNEKERPKCSFCDKPAEYYLPDESGKPKLYFCEDHALEWLKVGKVSYLPKIDSGKK